MKQDLIGKKFGHRQVIKEGDKPGYVLTRCSCGREKETSIRTLLKGQALSCGKCGKMVEKRSQSMIERYGAADPLKLQQFKQKAMTTMVERYGVDNPAKSESIQKKMKTTMLKRHGVSSALNLKSARDSGKEAAWTKQARDKRIQTSIDQYGTQHPTQSEAVMSKARKTLLDRYGVDCFFKTEHIRAILTSSRNPMKDPEIKKRFFDSLELKYGVRRLTDLEAFKNSVTKYKVDRETSLRQYLSDQHIAHVQYDAVIKVFRTQGKGAALEYIERSKTERLSSLEMFFQKNVMPLEKFDRKVLSDKGWRPDFKLNDNTYVNVDGLAVHSSIFRDHDYHHNLRLDFEAEGKRILQFYEDEVYLKPNIIKSMIHNAQGSCIKVYARKCSIVPMRMGIAVALLNEWHLMGRGSPGKVLALADPLGDVVSILTYRSTQHGIEILRFATKLGTVVVGGFGKLVSTLAELYPNQDIFSFCDMRYSTGKSYLALGFEKISEHVGFCWTNFRQRFNRMACRARNGKTEQEVAQELKWHRLYDAGQVKFILRK